MYYLNQNDNEIKLKFNNYAYIIKEDLLNGMINKKSNSRSYFEKRYDELIIKYLNYINIFNYSKVCSKFVHEVYELIPLNDTI
jgi:hypothetical protein